VSVLQMSVGSLAGPQEVFEEIVPWLNREPDEVDSALDPANRARLIAAVESMNDLALNGDGEAFYYQQLLLSKIYAMVTQISTSPTAEGSVVVHEVTRSLERACLRAEDSYIEPGQIESAPKEPSAYLSWLKRLAKSHRVYKHPYYREFIRDHATTEDLRKYVTQESVVDGRFDDLLAMMQVGTSGPEKMEIAGNFWDEMGNGDPDVVHTKLFNQIFQVFSISDEDLERELTAQALLSGNLAVLLCRYRRYYPEAIGFLGMTEWLVPDRFVNVVQAWERLGLPDVGIVYHKLHITIDSKHAAGWFHNVVVPAASSDRMRDGITRGTLWRLNSSARYLDERLAGVTASAAPELG
jgi:pyrroloquinoline quinone (PQQ) biosynthesis protein C